MVAVGDGSGGGSFSRRSRPSRCRPRHPGCLRGSCPRCGGVPDDVCIWRLAITVLVEPPPVPLSAVVSGPEYFRADALPCAGWSQGGRAGWWRQVVAPGGRAGWRVGHSASSLSGYDGEGGNDRSDPGACRCRRAGPVGWRRHRCPGCRNDGGHLPPGPALPRAHHPWANLSAPPLFGAQCVAAVLVARFGKKGRLRLG